MPENEMRQKLEERVTALIEAMEKMKIAEYVEYLHNTRKMMVVNLLAGVARGVGTAIGFTILGALVVYVLQKIVLLNLPLIGDFIADLVRLVNDSMSRPR